MKKVSFITEGGQRIQIVDTKEQVSDDADYYILTKDLHKFRYVAKVIIDRNKEKKITGRVASELVEKKLLWKHRQ